jgi:hypothetical protein
VLQAAQGGLRQLRAARLIIGDQSAAIGFSLRPLVRPAALGRHFTETGGYLTAQPVSVSPGQSRLGVSDGLVGEVGDSALDGLGVEEAHGFLVAELGEETLAEPEHDREELQPQLVDEVVLHQRS